jgi:hypothetical protein
MSEFSAYKLILRVLAEYWTICVILIATTCFLRSCCKRTMKVMNPTDPRDPQSLSNDIPYPNRAGVSMQSTIPTPSKSPSRARQPFEAFLVLDVEATCQLGTDFDYPNEIIVSTGRLFGLGENPFPSSLGISCLLNEVARPIR